MVNRVNSRLRVRACLLGLFSFAAVQRILNSLKKSSVIAAATLTLLALFSSTAIAQTPANDDDDDGNVVSILGGLLNQTVKPTVTTSIQPSTALFNQPLWFTVTITNPAILAPMKNVGFSQSFGIRFQANQFGSSLSSSPSTCTGTLTISTPTPGVENIFKLVNGIIPPKTTCTYQVRLQGVNPDSSTQTNFTLAGLTITGTNVVATTYPAGNGTPTSANLTYTTAYPLSIVASPPPYVLGSPITFTATAPASAGTLNGITFIVNGVAIDGTGTGLSRSVTIPASIAGNQSVTAYASASNGPSAVVMSPPIFVNAFNAVLDVASYSGTTVRLRVSVYNSTASSGELGAAMKTVGNNIPGINFAEVLPATNPRIFVADVYNADFSALVTIEINLTNQKVITNTIVMSGSGGSSGGEGQNGVTPQGGSAVGAMAGAFDVTDSGAATYTIPIAIPPGTAGLAPSLALSYSSQGGGGMAGVGWSLSGFSAIHRCTANQYIDNSRSALAYNANDKFCLDGQRLIKLADGTYRTERDSFSRITAVGGNAANPDYWQVESKAGLIMLYGSSEANAGANSKFVGPNNSIRAWAINKVKDRKANYYAIDYVLDTTNSVVVAQRPTTLRYTGNDTTGRATFASVELVYEANLPAEQALLYGTAGAQSQSLFRLKQIVTKESGSQVRTYSLTYKASVASGRSILTFVQECGFGSGGGAGLCLTATAITTPDSTTELSFTTQTPLADPQNGYTSPVLVADLDGDGKSDFIKYAGGSDGTNGHKWAVQLSGTGVQQYWYTNHGNARLVLGDFNGDGKTDLLSHFGFGASAQWERCLSTGVGFTCSEVTLDIPDVGLSNQAGADFDGDGRTDIVLYKGRNQSTQVSLWKVCLATDTGFQCSATVNGPIQTDTLLTGPGIPVASIGDFNGDGRADIAGYGNGGSAASQWQVAFSNFGSGTAGFTMGPANTPATRQWPTKGHVADLNGDGMADLLAGYNDEPGHLTDWRVCMSKGDGTFDCQWWPGRVSGREGGLLGDYNGDGRTDVAQWDTTVTPNAWKVCLSTGKVFNCSYWGTSVPWNADKLETDNLTGDFNGDGKTDITVYSNNQWQLIRPTGRIPDMVTQVKDALGKEANFAYEPLSTTSSYTKGNGATFPAIDIQSPMYVVTSMSTNNGVGGLRGFNYKYSGLRGHANGGGLLGFASRDVVDNLTSTTTTTTYSQDYANRIAGSPISMRTVRADKLLSSSTSSYHTRALAGSSPTVYQIFPASSASSSYDPAYSASAPFSSVSSSIALADIDSYGNVTKSTSSSSVVKVTNSTYDVDTSSWMIGRPRTVGVTSTYGGASLTRNSSFSYVAGTSLVSVETIEPGGGEVSVTTNHDYDASGNRTQSRVTGSGIAGGATTPGCSEPAGGADNCRSMKYGYEANGRYANSMTNAAGHTSSVEQNTRLGVVTKTIDANGITTSSTPDFLGRNIGGYSSLGINTATTYAASDIAGAVMKITSTASASPTSIAYIDILGREVRRDTQGADGLYYTVKMSYDARGRKLSVSRPYLSTGGSAGSTTFGYEDDLDRMIREVAPDGGITVIQPSGLTTTVYRAPSGEPTAGTATTQKTVRTVNDQGWTVSVIDALGQTTGYSHDPHGNLLQVAKPNQAAVVMTYDIRGRKNSLVDPDAGTITYSYNSAGDLLAESVSGGRRSSTSYDSLGRPLTRTAIAEGKTFTTTYSYDGSNAKGKLVSESSSTPSGVNTRSWAFDASSRVTSSTVTLNASPLPARSFTTATAYDANSRVQSITYPQNGNALNALKYEYQNGYFQLAKYNATTIWNTTDRFPDQQVKAASLGTLTIARTYDAIGRINTIKTTNASAVVLQNATFGFDTLGNLTSRTDSSAIPSLNESFCYDVLNRVKGSIGSCNTFNYDGAGNVTKPGVALAYTAATNRLSSVDGLGVTYDAGGNVKSDGTRIYSYTPYDVPDRISQGNQWMEFGFTGNGQRAYERDGANATASGITYFAGPGFFEQDNTIASGAATVSEVREYLATPAGTIGVVITNATGTTTTFYLQDHLGSNVASVNAITGVVTRSSYDVWGVRSGAALDKGNRGYTGHEHLDFGLIHMNGRVYDPRWGRFLQADPIIQSPYDLQNYNRYSYVMNNPLSLTDPTGFSSLDRFAARFTRNFALSIGDFGGAYLAQRHAYNTFQNPYVRTAAGIVAGYFTFGAASAWAASAGYGTIASGAIGGAAAGFASGGIQGGNLKSALSGALTGAVIGAIGGAFADASGGALVENANANKVALVDSNYGFPTASDYTPPPLFHIETINVTASRLPNLCGGYGYCALSSDGMSSALISFLGLGTMGAGGPTRAVPYVTAKFAMSAKAVAQITPKGIARVESHLTRFGPDPANELMLQRLKDALRTGEASTVDRAFYVHELKESAFVARGLSNAAAHDATLSWQGIAKIPGYESQLYVREAMGASPTTFSSAAKRAAGL